MPGIQSRSCGKQTAAQEVHSLSCCPPSLIGAWARNETILESTVQHEQIRSQCSPAINLCRSKHEMARLTRLSGEIDRVLEVEVGLVELRIGGKNDCQA